MQFQALAGRLVALVVVATVIGIFHYQIERHADRFRLYVASHFVTYTPISDESAYTSGLQLKEDRDEIHAENKRKVEECKAQPNPYGIMRCDLYYALRMPAYQFGEVRTQADLVSLGQAYRRHQWEQSEVMPTAWSIDSYHFMFITVYGLMALYAASCIFQWFRQEVWPRLKTGAARLKEATLLPAELKNIAANRRLRHAEQEFQTLKNLYENGLITHEMLEARKMALREGLGEASVFAKDGG